MAGIDIKFVVPLIEDNLCMLNAENFEINVSAHKVIIKNQAIKLTPTEFNILKLLMENEGRIFSRDQIINEVFGYDFEGYNRNIDTHISNLRKKIIGFPTNFLF